MRVLRMQRLRDFIRDEVQDDWWDMASWVTPGWVERKCNTAACAMGWATAIWPKKLTIKRGVYTDSAGSIVTAPEMIGTPEYEAYEAWCKHNHHGVDDDGYVIGTWFFDIPSRMASYLFDPGCYDEPAKDITRETVIDRIQACITYVAFKNRDDDFDKAEVIPPGIEKEVED